MKIGNLEVNGKLVLAPMAGYTNSSYRNICGEMGASLVYSEMISDKGLLFDNDRTLRMANGDKDKYLYAIQLFGGDPIEMGKAAKIIDENTKCDIIDINMGCPVKKVVKANSGSYLMIHTDTAIEILKQVKANTKKPVTVKMRLGWDHSLINCVEFAKELEKAGADAIAIHGRCKSDMYTGKVDLDYIKKVKEALTIPVIGNGDIKSYEDALKMLEYTNVDAVMIGRASLGNPWIFKEINNKLNGIDYVKPSKKERVEMLLRHIDDLIAIKGEHIAVLEMRTLAIWYVKGFNNLHSFKDKCVKAKTKRDLVDCINELLLNQGEENEDITNDRTQ